MSRKAIEILETSDPGKSSSRRRVYNIQEIPGSL